MSFKIIIKKKSQIIDCKIVETRDEAEAFIKQCKALPIEYKPDLKSPDCFYELTHK